MKNATLGKLQDDQPVEPSEEQKEEFRNAYRLALHRLSRREHAEVEVEAYLLKKGHSPQMIEQTIRRLVEEGSLSNERYARVLTRHLILRGKGPAYITARLREKGISLDPAEIKGFREEMDGQTEADQVYALLERRYPKAHEDKKQRLRAYHGLRRRGFSHEIVQGALDRWILFQKKR